MQPSRVYCFMSSSVPVGFRDKVIPFKDWVAHPFNLEVAQCYSSSQHWEDWVQVKLKRLIL